MNKAVALFLTLVALALCIFDTQHTASPVRTAEARQSGRSPDGLWQDVDERPVSDKFMTIIPLEAPGVRTLRLRTGGLRERLLRLARPGRTARDVISLPVPQSAGGGWLSFRIEESSMLSSALAAESPQIKTFKGRGVEDPTATVRIILSPTGLSARVISRRGAFQIERLSKTVTGLAPVAGPSVQALGGALTQTLSRPEAERAVKSSGFERLYVSFSEREQPRPPGARNCLVTSELVPDDDIALRDAEVAATPTPTPDQPIRVYRLAIAATAEYTAAMDDGVTENGGAAEDAYAAILETVYKVEDVYEREFGIRFKLSDKQRDLIFTDPQNDEYTNNDADKLLEENQRKLDRVVGSSNYDIGHVFSTAGGGKAILGSACRAGSKAKGETGLSDPSGRTFPVDYVAHEIGHQFGAHHTYNGVEADCTADVVDANGNVISWGERWAATAHEPGSGSTIMSYAGICARENVESQPGEYFHAASLAEISRHINGAGACFDTQPNDDRPPVVNGGPDYTVPRNTPFRLAAEGSDPDRDELNYVWEQFRERGWNPRPGPPNNDRDGETRPLFRSYAPNVSPRRTFPSMEALLLPGRTKFEELPTLELNAAGRTDIAFRVTARDERGRYAFDDVVVIFVSKTTRQVGGAAQNVPVGPFFIREPGAGATWRRGERKTVVWDVANTDIAPVDCKRVRISLLLRGDEEHPVVLLDSTENNGSAEVTLPANLRAGSRVRVMVEALGNVFFNVSPTDIRVN